MLKLYHARGVFHSSVSWVTMDGAPESCCGDWVNRVRLASDRASTDCWQRPCPVSCSQSAVNPRKRAVHTPEHAPAATVAPPPAAGLTSPHQNVRWQNRKAAVCSHHLKVHLHTLPAKSVSPPLSLPRQWEWATETSAWISTRVGFNYFFFQTVYVWFHF